MLVSIMHSALKSRLARGAATAVMRCSSNSSAAAAVRQQQWHRNSIGAESCNSMLSAPIGAPELAAARRHSMRRRSSERRQKGSSSSSSSSSSSKCMRGAC
eukprot:15115712-Alexandrium_andersonii.AAC.1